MAEVKKKSYKVDTTKYLVRNSSNRQVAYRGEDGLELVDPKSTAVVKVIDGLNDDFIVGQISNNVFIRELTKDDNVGAIKARLKLEDELKARGLEAANDEEADEDIEKRISDYKEQMAPQDDEDDEPEDDDPVDLQKMNKSDLQSVAADLNVEFEEAWTKAELIEKIEEAQKAGE